jgi:FKBP-type peptidyl-prolyl cis-trans isomerase SlyD
MVAVGNIIPLMDADGNRLNAEVLEINESSVSVDLNHPLAGENLHFVGKVIDIHAASEEEIAAYTGGGCSGGCCSDGDCNGQERSGCGSCGCN